MEVRAEQKKPHKQDMESLRQYGVAVVPMGQFVRTYCLESGNMKQSMFLKNLQHAKWAWKEIFRQSLWEIKTVAVQMCDRTITLPDDCERLINISVVDVFRRLHPLTFDSDLNTARINCIQNSCSCTACGGTNTLCGALDNITMTTETIEIQGEDYTKTTWVRSNGCGDIEQVTRTPMLNASTNEVEYVDSKEMLCQVDVDSNGCIRATQPNYDILVRYCGCGTDSFNGGIGPLGWTTSVYSPIIPAVYNSWGYYNFNAANRSMVHIFRNERNSTCSEDNPDWQDIGTILVSYQTNGETPGEEILIPEYAYDALLSGIIYRQHRLNPKDGDKDQVFYNHFRRDRMSIARYLNPVNMDQIEKLHTQKRPW